MQPHLETKRLVLRRFTLADFDALFEITRQPEIIDILPDWGMTLEQLNTDLAYWVNEGYPNFESSKPEMLYAIYKDTYLINLGRGWHGDSDPVKMARVDLGNAQITDCDLRGAHIEGGQLDRLKINGIPYADLHAAWEEINTKAM